MRHLIAFSGWAIVTIVGGSAIMEYGRPSWIAIVGTIFWSLFMGAILIMALALTEAAVGGDESIFLDPPEEKEEES